MRTAAPGARRERGVWTARHWLRHPEGFRVDAGSARLGYVEGVIRGPDGEPEFLRVRDGGGGRTTLVPVAEITELRPESECIVVRPRAHRTGPAPEGDEWP